MKLTWTFCHFDTLSAGDLYDILQLRQQVFVVEQQCVYQDCDGRDQRGHHLRGYIEGENNAKPVAYLRIIFPDTEEAFCTVGRVVVHPFFRGKGLARALMAHALEIIEQTSPATKIHISAQAYLVKFYQSLNFHISSESYLEDGIPHIDMINPSNGTL